MNIIGYALSMAKKFYDDDTYNHALRVATYVAENPMINNENMQECIALGIMHELWNTDYIYTPMMFDSHFLECMMLLKQPEDMEYENYIKNIKDCADTNPEAYWVKMADVKDSLLETNTSKDIMKERYSTILSYLL